MTTETPKPAQVLKPGRQSKFKPDRKNGKIVVGKTKANELIKLAERVEAKAAVELAPQRKEGTVYDQVIALNLEFIAALKRRGLTDYEVAAEFEITDRTLQRYKARYPELAEVLNNTKTFADAAVETSLYKRANGFTVSETTEKIKMNSEGEIESREITKAEKVILPDTTAMIFYLKNRCPHLWRDVSRVDHTLAKPEPINITPSEVKDLLLDVMVEDDC